MGGFARRMSYWNAFGKRFTSTPTLRIDGGSIFSSGAAESPILNRWMLQGTYRSKLDALNVTAWDLPVWQEMGDLAAAGMISKEWLKIPLISANVTPKVANFPALQRYIVREISLGPNAARPKIRIGITGVLADPEERLSRRDFHIQDPVSALKQVFEEMKDKTDYRIVLTDFDLGKSISLTVVVPEINLLVASHNYDYSEPQTIGQTLLIVPVNEGRMISEVRLAMAAKGETSQFESRFIPLDRTVPDEPEMGQLLRKAQTELDPGKKTARPPGP